ncbi:MAG: LysR family transcriptional regulator [Syntrophobacteraceae bacterium]
MELRQLKTFQTVARMLSFHRAAEVLNYSQSAVSTQIKLLEEEFGVSLFNRLGKRICLTEAGQMLMSYSQKILDIEQETIAKVSGWEEPHGSISIRIPQSISTYLLPSVLCKFQASFPKVGFDIGTCAYEALIHELKTGITDVAFLLAESIPFAELETEVLGFETLVIVSSPDHPLAGRPGMHIGDLAGQSILLPKHDCSYKMVFQRILVEEKIEPATYMEINSIEAIKQCVFKGIGVAMLPLMAVKQEIAQGRMRILPWPQEQLETAILMIRHKDKWLSPILKAFIETMRLVVRSKELYLGTGT